MKPALFFFLSICFATDLVAQAPSVRHHLGLTSGFYHYRNRDLLGSPIAYRGNSYPVGLSYRAVGARSFHDVRIAGMDLDLSTNLSTFSRHNGYSLFADMHYGYGRLLTSLLNERLQLYGGGRFKNRFFLRLYLFDEFNTTGTWEASSALEAQFTAVFQVAQGHRLLISAAGPAIAYVNRSPYAISGDEIFKGFFKRMHFFQLGAMAGPWNFRQVEASAAYRYQMMRHIDLNLSYSFLYSRYDRPRTTTSLMNNFGIGVSATW